MSFGREYLAHFRLIRIVRTGHSCDIWEAYDEQKQCRCALKVLQKAFLRDKTEIEQLRNEHDIAKDLQHPNLIEVYGFFGDVELPFVSMEFYNVKNLKQVLRLEKDSLQPQHLTPLFEQMAESLKYIHRKGILHRDVKPDNFLADLSQTKTTGALKLIDFSIAQREKKAGLMSVFTRNKIQGTRSYMSPEQITGKHIDVRADIYSFGCVIFELVCRRLPFTAATPDELLQKHLSAQAPSMLPFNNDVTPDFNALVMSMLAKKRDARPDSMTTVLAKLKSTRMFRSRPIEEEGEAT
ncbi:MAG TPA: serine/threonine-protein kinase [Pirellulaceae bacterium]|nr:serine/threonine-protein kinase [Pirellulaceae bacterium]